MPMVVDPLEEQIDRCPVGRGFPVAMRHSTGYSQLSMTAGSATLSKETRRACVETNYGEARGAKPALRHDRETAKWRLSRER